MQNRREFIQDGTVFLAVLTATGGAKLALDVEPEPNEAAKFPVLPPGAGAWEVLEKRCVACGLCVTNCPEHAIQFHQDLGPVTLDFQRGACRWNCAVCGDVCPTGAIQPKKLPEKQRTVLGFASFDPRYCVEVQDQKPCGHCAEQCPTGALTMRVSPTLFFLPTLDPQACVGCGACVRECVKTHAKFPEYANEPTAMTVSGLEAQVERPEAEIPPFFRAIQLLRSSQAAVVVQRGEKLEIISDPQTMNRETLKDSAICVARLDEKMKDFLNSTPVSRVYASECEENALLLLWKNKTYGRKIKITAIQEEKIGEE